MGQAVGGGTATITYTRPTAFQTAKPSGPRPAGAEPSFDWGNKQKQEQDFKAINELMDKGDVEGARQKMRPMVELGKQTGLQTKGTGPDGKPIKETPEERLQRLPIQLGRQRERHAAALEIVARLDVSSKGKQKDFWSGDKHRAGEFAKKDGHTILEQTNGARVLDDWEEMNVEAMPWMDGGSMMWGGVSAKYASDADGKHLRILQTESRFPFGGDVWRKYEWPKVKAQGKAETIEIYKLDAQGNVMETVNLDPKTGRIFDANGNEFLRDHPVKGSVSRVDPNGNIVDEMVPIRWGVHENKTYDPNTGEVTEWKRTTEKNGQVTVEHYTPIKDPQTGEVTGWTFSEPDGKGGTKVITTDSKGNPV